MAESVHKATIVAAVIGLIGTLGTALISNWDKILGHPEQIEKSMVVPTHQSDIPSTKRVAEQKASPVPESAPAPRLRNLSGNWRDTNYPNNGLDIQQDGDRVRFGGWGINLAGVPFQSAGTGNVNGDNISLTHTARDRFGGTSSGSCSGAVSSDSSRITLTCTDSAVGTFVVTVVR